ncbi:MAG: helix-turn-helix transcriptional regulator [Syntrophomonas sp.]
MLLSCHSKQENVAKELGISTSSLSNYERGERIPDMALLVKIADYYKVSVSWLLGSDEELDEHLFERHSDGIFTYRYNWEALI